jgi:hypothetical protein
MNDEFAMDYYQLNDDSLEWYMISEAEFIDEWFEGIVDEANKDLQEVGYEEIQRIVQNIS